MIPKEKKKFRLKCILKQGYKHEGHRPERPPVFNPVTEEAVEITVPVIPPKTMSDEQMEHLIRSRAASTKVVKGNRRTLRASRW